MNLPNRWLHGFEAICLRPFALRLQIFDSPDFGCGGTAQLFRTDVPGLFSPPRIEFRLRADWVILGAGFEPCPYAPLRATDDIRSPINSDQFNGRASNRSRASCRAGTGSPCAACEPEIPKTPISVAVSKPSPKRKPKGYICQLVRTKRNSGQNYVRVDIGYLLLANHALGVGRHQSKPTCSLARNRLRMTLFSRIKINYESVRAGNPRWLV